MKKVKGFLAVLAALALLLNVSPAFAQARYSTRTSQPLESSGIFTDEDGNEMNYAVWVYGVEIFADEASSFMGVYNTTTVGAATAATVKDEIGEATQYDTATRFYEQPRYYSSGVVGIISTGVGFVHYGPQPK